MKLESAVMHTRATLEEATDRTRRLMFELRPAILHENGLRAALRVLADQTARATNATARVRCDPARYDPSIEELVYRTIQEALANIRKHAAAERISVTVAEDAGALRGVIRDDGRGFDVAAARPARRRVPPGDRCARRARPRRRRGREHHVAAGEGHAGVVLDSAGRLRVSWKPQPA